MVVTVSRLVPDQISQSGALIEGGSEKPDIIILPVSMTSTPVLVPEFLRARSLVDIDREISILLPSAKPRSWLEDMTALHALSHKESSRRWRTRVHRMIDLEDMLQLVASWKLVSPSP